MANRSARRIGFIFLLVYTSTSNAQHGLSPELAAAVIISVKMACDHAIPGYRENTDAAYARWKLQNTEIISRAEKFQYAGMTLDDYIQTFREQILSLPQDDRPKACEEFTSQLELPLR